MSTALRPAGCGKRRSTSLSGEGGAALFFVLLVTMLILVVTVTVMALVRADVSGSIRQKQAVQVFNVAEAGLHYAIARLQQSGADTYSGQTISISDSAAGTVGQATIAVRCMDGTAPTASGCPDPHSAYRRVQSTGSLTVPGPTRLLTAVVAASLTPLVAGVCGYERVTMSTWSTFYSDVGSNGDISLDTGVRICDPLAATTVCGPTPGGGAGGGNAIAVGTISCGSGCSSVIEGVVQRGQPAGSVCPSVTLTPPGPYGTTNLSVPIGVRVTLDPSVNYGRVSVGGGGECSAPVQNRATIIIDTGPDPNSTVTIRMRSLVMDHCSRLVLSGAGKAVLWVLEPTQGALSAGHGVFFGSADLDTNVPVADDRLTVNVVSSSNGAVYIDASVAEPGLVLGRFLVPNGGFSMNTWGQMRGHLIARRIFFDSNTVFRQPTSSAVSYSSFSTVRSWKDQ